MCVDHSSNVGRVDFGALSTTFVRFFALAASASPDMGKPGKSPGRWIKDILFGKKSSKSHHAKKTGYEKEVLVSSKARDVDLASAEPVISHPTLNAIVRSERNSDVENKENSNLPFDGGIVLAENQNTNLQGSATHDAPSDPETMTLEKAATMAQAAFRGYLARRAFCALKGIIRLQALIQGHLVRRQAVATLCCMLGIVKLQALARGRKVRNSDIGQEVHQKCSLTKPLGSKLMDATGVIITTWIIKLTSNAFIHKLLASLPTVMPLQLCYDPVEPNSVPSWLDRCSGSCFWKPVPQPKRIPPLKTQRKHAKGQMVEAETGRPKRSVRKVPSSNVDNNSGLTACELDKPKHNLRKVSTHPSDTVQENPQNELEKVKRNLRKVHNPMIENPVQTEVESEKQKQNLEKVPSILGDNVMAHGLSNSSEKKKEATLTGSKLPDPVKLEPILTPAKDLEMTPELLEMNDASEELQDDQPLVVSKPSFESENKGDQIPITNGELSNKEETTSNGNHKSRRKATGPAKQEQLENGLQSTPMLPSYIAATESAKAKLRAQGSSRFSQDGSEKANATRPHSLPSSTTSTVSSQSPRTQRAGSGGKTGNKSDKSLLASRDGNAKGIQMEWR